MHEVYLQSLMKLATMLLNQQVPEEEVEGYDPPAKIACLETTLFIASGELLGPWTDFWMS